MENQTPPPNNDNSKKENEKEFLLFYMQQTSEEMRHLEDTRTNATNFILLSVGAILAALIQSQSSNSFIIILLAIIIIIFGIIGRRMVQKLFQLHQRGQDRLDQWYELYLNKFVGNHEIILFRDVADEINRNNFPELTKKNLKQGEKPQKPRKGLMAYGITLNVIWARIYLTIILIGGSMFTCGIYMCIFPNPTDTKSQQAQINQQDKDIHTLHMSDSLHNVEIIELKTKLDNLQKSITPPVKAEDTTKKKPIKQKRN